jgi:hypothetical protein
MAGFNLLLFSSFWNVCRSMGFCTEECRNEYFLDYRCRLTMATVEAEGRSEARKPVEAAAATTEGQGVGYRRIFFTCAEVESFP